MGRFDSVDENVVKALDAKGAVKLLHSLIIAEIRRLSISFELVSVPYEVDTPDGGIDAVVSTGSLITGSHLVFEGKTYYQSKSGSRVTFTENGLKEVLCDTTPQKKLKPKIREIAEANGHLVLYFTGQSAPNIEEAIKKATEIIKAGVPKTKLKVHIVQVETIIGILNDYISLRHRLLNIDGFPGLIFDEWQKHPIMGNHLEIDEVRQQKIDSLKSLIRSTNEEDRMIRVTGYPGIGKTRTVLEALREPDLMPLVVYFEKPSQVLDSNLITELGARQSNEAIIVVDECDTLSHVQLTNAIASAQSKIKIVTIYNEPVGATRNVKIIDFNDDQLTKESIVAIIESYGLPNDVATRWEPFCDGSPRVAHMIAENLSNDKGSDLLANPSYDMAMERILANTEDLKSETYKKRKTIISWLSLFHKFGWSSEFESERKFILHKIQSKTGYSESDIETVIQELKDRKVLQGDKTLYISPRLLHIRAWVWWWELYGNNFDLNEIRRAKFNGEETEMSPDLYNWFTEMFQYAREVEGASEVVKKLLALDGPLKNEPEMIEALRGNFFLSLTRADPDSALPLLENWFAKKTDADLEKLQDRMNLVRILENMAIWGHLFTRAANLLFRLAATEHDHTYSNNSEGTFAELFSNGPGKVAPTEAEPKVRFPIMERAVKSKNPKEQLLGIKAIDAALEVTHWSRVSGAEIQGLREEPKLWSPKTYDEIYQAVRHAWLLLISVLPELESEALDTALTTIDNNIRGLALRTSDAHTYLDEYAKLVKDGLIPTRSAVNTTNIIRRFDSKQLSEKTLKSLQSLMEHLEGDDITSRLKRYIAYNSTEDWWGDEEDVNKSQTKVAELVREVAGNPDIINSNEWLFTQEAHNAHKLGRGLAEIDDSFTLFDRLISLQESNDANNEREKTCWLLSGYLFGVSQLNPEKWQEFLDVIRNHERLVHWYAEICWRSHIDDHNAEVILELAKSELIKTSDFHMFKFGAQVKDLSDKTFDKWIEYLLSKNTLEAIATAIDLFASHYVFQEEKLIPKDLAVRLITSPTLLTKNQRLAREIDYDWSTLTERFIEQYPDDLDGLLDMLLENFGVDETIFSTYGGYVEKTLNLLVRANPSKAWKKVMKYLDGKHNYRLEMSWLGGGFSFKEEPVGALSLFPKDEVFAWVEEDPEKRSPKIAYMIPHDYTHEPGEESWFAMVLDKYGDNETVLNSLHANFGTEGYSGPASLHYAKKVEKIKRFAELHKESQNIQAWSNKVIASLNSQVQNARMEEERRGY